MPTIYHHASPVQRKSVKWEILFKLLLVIVAAAAAAFFLVVRWRQELRRSAQLQSTTTLHSLALCDGTMHCLLLLLLCKMCANNGLLHFDWWTMVLVLVVAGCCVCGISLVWFANGTMGLHTTIIIASHTTAINNHNHRKQVKQQH